MARAEGGGREGDSDQVVLGTAGHIDHGKTALIGALTGVDTDRLPEEKARGITIDLGFAALELGDTRVSVVDVPGHERLVRTMVSGASGIDFVLLVVAADEGVMLQTREHVAICRLLGIERGVVALTKRDLVDEEMCELASEEVRDLLAPTPLADAEIVPVSSTTGEGIDALRAALLRAVTAGQPRTTRHGPPRLAIDRCFAIRGFGTVVTGTLVGGSFDVGDSVSVYPGERKARIRGLQSHDQSVERAQPGMRCAINLQGVEVAELSRGQVVTHTDALRPTLSADLQLWWLESAPECLETVAIEFLSGTSERRARLAPIGGSGFLPGQPAFARLHIDGDPVPLLPGDRFIARGFARTQGMGGTLGGGVVLDIAPPHRRRSDPALHRELEHLSTGSDEQQVLARIVRTGLTGVDEPTLRRETGHTPAEFSELMQAIARGDEALRAGAQLWIAREAIERLEGQLEGALDAFHRAEPLRPGMARATLRGKLPGNVRAECAELALTRLVERGAIELTDDVARRPGFSPTLDAEAEAAIQQIRTEAGVAGLEPPNPREWAEHLGIHPERFRDLLAHLEREAVLVRAPGDLWFDRGAVDALRERVLNHFESHSELDTQSYKALIATTRRTAMPLMELLDELHVTRRAGDVRILRSGS